MRHDARSISITLRRFAALPALALAVVALAPASALADAPSPGDIPDNQAFVAYKGQGFSLEVPEGWSRTTQGGGARFVDKYNAITVTTARQSAKPTVARAKRSGIARLKTSTNGFSNPQVSTITRPGGSGVLIAYRATSPRNAVTGKRIVNDVQRYELWHAGKLAIITLEAPHGSDNVDPWKLVTNSFRWTA
jgi:hypothetical protein